MDLVLVSCSGLDVCSSGASAMSGRIDGECGSSSFVFLGGVDCSAKGSHIFSRAGRGTCDMDVCMR